MWEWAKDKFYKVGSDFGTTNEYTYTDNTGGYNDLFYRQQQVTAGQYQIQLQQHQQLQQQYINATTAFGPGSPFQIDPLAEQKDMLQKVHDAAKAYAYERVLCA